MSKSSSFRSFRALGQDVLDFDFTGLVLADQVWEKIATPPAFVRFRTDYCWRPFIKAR